MPRKKFNWKQNLNTVPAWAQEKVADADGDELVVATVKKVPESDIAGGMYEHLEIRLRDGILDFPARILPDPRTGRWSKINLDGKEIVRKDLPMYPKTRAMDAPDWNGYGTHTVYIDQMVYPRDLIPPKYLDIQIELIDEEISSAGHAYVFRFTVDEVLNRLSNMFLDDLKYNMNVLQENVGQSDIYPSGLSIDEYRSTITVDWEVLPVGEREENLRRILSGVRSPQIARVAMERYDVLEGLRPTDIIKGTSGFSRYFGAKFADDLVVFENLNTGNALYVMFDNWEELSRKTRMELLHGDRDGFERIVHTSGWKTNLEHVVTQHRRPG